MRQAAACLTCFLCMLRLKGYPNNAMMRRELLSLATGLVTNVIFGGSIHNNAGCHFHWQGVSFSKKEKNFAYSLALFNNFIGHVSGSRRPHHQPAANPETRPINLLNSANEYPRFYLFPTILSCDCSQWKFLSFSVSNAPSSNLRFNLCMLFCNLQSSLVFRQMMGMKTRNHTLILTTKNINWIHSLTWIFLTVFIRRLRIWYDDSGGTASHG